MQVFAHAITCGNTECGILLLLHYYYYFEPILLYYFQKAIRISLEIYRNLREPQPNT